MMVEFNEKQTQSIFVFRKSWNYIFFVFVSCSSEIENMKTSSNENAKNGRQIQRFLRQKKILLSSKTYEKVLDLYSIEISDLNMKLLRNKFTFS